MGQSIAGKGKSTQNTKSRSSFQLHLLFSKKKKFPWKLWLLIFFLQNVLVFFLFLQKAYNVVLTGITILRQF